MADDYDPFENRPPEQRTTTSFAAFMHLLKAAIGSGILFLPYAFKKTGWVAAVLCSVIVGITSIHTAVITVQCGQLLTKRARVPALNFAQVAETSFKLGPEGFQKYAKAFGIAVNIFVCFVQYQTSVVYSLYIATSFKQLFDYYTESFLDVKIYIIIFVPLFCCCAMIPSFKFLVPFSVIGTFLLFFGVFSSFKYILADWQSPGRLDTFTTAEKIPIYCAIFLFAVHNMSMIMPLENGMKKPKQMPMVLASSMVLNVAANVIFGFLGYNKYTNACDTVIKNLPMEEVLSNIIKFAVTFSVFCTYPLQYYVPINILWPMLAEKYGDKYLYEVIFRLSGVFVTTLLQLAIPQLAQLLGLLSAISIATVMLCIPILIETATKWNDQGTTWRIFLVVKNILIFILYVIILCFGIAENINEIIIEFTGSRTVEDPMCV